MKRLLLSCLFVPMLYACGDHDSNGDHLGATDAGISAQTCRVDYAGCMTYVTPDGGPTVDFGGNVGDTYAPKCLRVAKGTTVTFKGDFAAHPLAQGCGTSNVISNGADGTKDITFNEAGTWGYYSRAHGQPTGGGMAGAIRVTE